MDPILKKNAITYGVISAIFGILVTLIMYVIDLKLFVNMWIGLFMIAVWIIIGVLLLNKCKKDKKGQLSFKEGFTAYFLSALIGILISTFFNIFLFNFFDTEARDVVSNHFIDFQVEMLEKFNAPAKQIKDTVIELKENSQFTINGQLFGILKSLIGAIIFGLILAAIFKTKTRENF